MEPTEMKLPSGAILRIQVAPFADAKALYQAFLREVRGVKVDFKKDVEAFLKDLACIAFSSPEVEAALWKCFSRCLIDGKRVDQDAFEERREDFTKATLEVMTANLSPFMKSLYAELSGYFAVLAKARA